MRQLTISFFGWKIPEYYNNNKLDKYAHNPQIAKANQGGLNKNNYKHYYIIVALAFASSNNYYLNIIYYCQEPIKWSLHLH